MTAAAPEDAPPEALAARLAADWAGEPVRELARFPTGLAHFVYDVALASGARVVVRLARPGQRDAFAGALHWSSELRPRGVPLPEPYAAGERDGVAYLLLERLPGRDLGLVYAELSARERRELAQRIAAIQGVFGALPEGRGFGYVATPEGPFRFASWRALLEALLARAFLDDTTTKNVIVHEGRLAGIVDVDVVCYGDPLFPIALTRTALENQGEDPDYVEYWCEALALSSEARRALCLYTAVFCVEFLSEIGQRFNHAEPIAPDRARIARPDRLLARELARLENP